MGATDDVVGTAAATGSGRSWDRFLTATDRQVFEAGGYGQRSPMGDKPALLVIDVTYNFCGDRPEPILESIQRWRSSSGERAWRAVPHLQALIGRCREQKVPVIYTRGAPRRSDGFDRGRWADKNRRQAQDTAQGDEILDEIAPAPTDLVVEKRKPSAFFGTTLVSHLVSYGVDTLLICGTSTSGCVRATAVDAFSYDFHVAVVEEATFDRGEASHAMTLFDLDMKYANVLGVDEALGYLDRVHR
jgi:maleamate amidohydrolase